VVRVVAAHHAFGNANLSRRKVEGRELPAGGAEARSVAEWGASLVNPRIRRRHDRLTLLTNGPSHRLQARSLQMPPQGDLPDGPVCRVVPR
jgi:hypothetical protein